MIGGITFHVCWLGTVHMEGEQFHFDITVAFSNQPSLVRRNDDLHMQKIRQHFTSLRNIGQMLSALKKPTTETVQLPVC
jgi:hypothetical protein